MSTKTSDRLAQSAARLFQEKGYEGVGLSEILKLAKAPKGSLYHHFRNGKSDLAIAAANFASREMLRIIDDAFRPAETYKDGMTTLFFKCAKLFDIMGRWNGCPVSGILLNGSPNPIFRETSEAIFDAWIARVAGHGERLGLSPEEAEDRATHLFVVLQGGWDLARARSDSGVLRNLPALLAHGL